MARLMLYSIGFLGWNCTLLLIELTIKERIVNTVVIELLPCLKEMLFNGIALLAPETQLQSPRSLRTLNLCWEFSLV